MTGDMPNVQVDASSPDAFIRSITPAAQWVQDKTGIPAAAMIGMAANETGYGKAAPGNNLFGIKGSGPAGSTTSGTWEDYGNGPVQITDQFRRYDNATQSFQDFVNFLRDNPRYQGVMNLVDQGQANVGNFVQGLKDAGYMTDPNYVGKIQNIVGQWQPTIDQVRGTAQQGLAAVNNAVDAARSQIATRTSQFALGLSSGDAYSFCGPAAAIAFAQTYGRNPTVDEAKQLAQQVGWNPSQGMAGVGSEVQLLNAMGVDAHATQGVDWAQVGRDASGGNPVIIDTPGHYYYLDGYNADSGKFHVGTSGTDLKGGSEWMSADQINAMPQSQGAARAAIFADHPLAQNDGLAQSTTAAQGSTSMTTMQPATQPASDLLSTVTGAVQSKAQDVMNAVQNVGNPLEAAFGTPEQPSGLSNAIMNNPLMQGVQAVNPVREALFPTILDPSVRAQQEQEDALGLSAFQKRLAGQGDQVTPEEQQAESNQMQRAQMIGLTMPNVGAVAQAVARPGNVPLSDWLRGAYRGGIIGGLNTAADVAFNASLTPALSGITGTVRDLASFQPGRLQGRLLGAQSGIVNWADNWLQGLRNSLNGPNTITARANPGAATWAGRVVEGMGAIHGAFQNATSELIESMEHGAESGANASATGANGAQWFQEFQNQFSQPVSATVKAMGDRAALRGDLGQLTGALGRLVGNMGPVGDALFPVYRMGMAMANRMVEFTPVGLAGTVADIGKAVVGRGPYATGLGSTPASSAVGPLSERLTNNLLGTALSMWLANKALGGTITGTGPTDPGEHQVWLANGNQPNSFLGPDGAFHSWEHLPPALRGPLMTAGAYADAVQAYNASSAKQAATGPAAYGVEDPRMAAASQLISEVGQQLMSATPMRTFANLYDALQTGSVAGKAMGTASAVGSSVLGGLVPFSGEVRSIAQMTDPYQRQVVRPITPDLLQQSIGERVAENIPGLRQGLPVAQDVLGRPLQNPLQGLGELSPVRSAAGQPTAVLQAMQSAGVAPAATPDTVPYGRGEIRLNPQEQRAFEQYRGQIIQQYAGGLVASPQWQQMGQLAQQRALSNIDQQAQAAAGRLVLRDIVAVGQGPSRMQFTGALAPVLGYGPDVLGNQALLQAELARSQTYRQTLMQALQGSGSSNLQQLLAANAAAASATQGP